MMSLFSTLLAALLSSQPAFVETPCADKQIASVARCGTIKIAENRDLPAGRQIDLNLIIIRAKAPKPDLPPLFDIDGGPGLPATKNAAFYATFGDAYRARRDIVLVDQRGTGQSNPLLCPEVSRPEDHYKPMLPAEGVIQCRRRLEKTADLRRYGTAEAVADLDAVRAALGYEKIDMFAVSYGTTVALRYMAVYPGRTRAAVLLGAAPPSAMPPRYHATAGQRALDLLFQDCATDPLCKAAFPAPAADFRRAMERLGSGAEVSPRIFAEKLRSLMYSPTGARRIPWIVHRAAAGDLMPFFEATKRGGGMPYADGMFLSVTCSESFALMDYAAAATEARRTSFGDYRLQRQREACRHWPAGKAAAGHLSPLKSDAAVLLLSGRLDPVTPPEWADEIARSFPNGRHLVMTDGGHIIDGLSAIDTCFDPLVLRFYETSDARGLDGNCIQEMKAGPFVLAEAALARASR